MKRIVLLCLTALLSLSTWAANIADFIVPNDEGVDIYYHITDADARTIETTYTGSSSTDTSLYVGDITIPETVTYEGTTYTVTGIGELCFYQATDLGKIELPKTLTYIGETAFRGSNIREITIPDEVTELGQDAFLRCESLETVVVGSSVSLIRAECFGWCTALSSITSKNPTPPETLRSVFANVPTGTCVLYVPSQSVELYQAAYGWKDFTNIVGFGYSFSVITTDATDITGTSATLNGVVSAQEGTIFSCGFEYWEGESDVKTVEVETIEDVNISTTVTGLNKATTYTFRAFALTEDGITYGDELTFYTRAYNFMVDDIYYSIPGDATEVEVIWGSVSQAIGTSTYVGDITIPETVTYEGTPYKVVGIGNNAFYKCKTLETITIPASVTYIADQAFWDCSSLTKVDFLGEGLNSIGYRAFTTCSSLTSINLPNSLASLGERCFENCSALPSINISGKVSVIPEQAFYNCSALSEISFAEGLDSIGYRAFYYCESLTEINLPSTVTALGDNVFELCRGITKVSLPEGLLSIGDYTFYVCTHLTDMLLPSSLERIGEGAFWSCGFTEMTIPDKITRIEDSTFIGCPLVSINLPEGLTYIGDDAFFSCAELPSINLPEGLTYIGEQAFANCTSLAEITIPGSVPSIKYQTFYFCSSLKKIILNEGVTTIEDMGIYSCTGLETISLPESLSSIGVRAFEYCISLKEITIPSQITAILSRTFQQCSHLTKVTLPEGLTRIDYHAFLWCERLPEITIPNSVTEIGESVFIQCYALAKVTLGSGLNSIGATCFAYCYVLSDFISLAQTPPSLYDSTVFSGSPISTCNLYVPADAVNSYTSTSIWKEFNIMAIAPSTLQTLEATQVAETTAVINGSISTGTLPIRERGFEYWEGNDEDNIQTIVVDTTDDGAISATLGNLTYSTTYTYRTYCVTQGGTEYGDSLTFTTLDDPSGINQVGASITNENIEGIYTTGGQKINNPVKGVNVIRYNDGTVKKVYVK